MRRAARSTQIVPLSRKERGRGEGTAASGERKSQRRPDPLKDGVEIAADLFIVEAEDLHAEALEDFGAPPVVFREPIVLLAVDLRPRASPRDK